MNNFFIYKTLEICQGNPGAIHIMSMVMSLNDKKFPEVYRKLESCGKKGSEICDIFNENNKDINMFVNAVLNMN